MRTNPIPKTSIRKPWAARDERRRTVVSQRVAWTTFVATAWLACLLFGCQGSSCSAATLELTLRPGESGAESQATLILPHLDVTSVPKQERESIPRIPLVVVMHGGGWFSGDKWMVAMHSERLAESGIAVLNMNYRLAPKNPFPAPVDDVRNALLLVVDRADRWRIDLTRIGLFGYSAGGHLATLVGLLADEPIGVQSKASAWPETDPRWKRLPQIAAVAAGGPYCDFRKLPIDSTLMSYFLGGSRRDIPKVYEAASSTAHASSGDPPVQLIHGDKDIIVPIASSLGLRDALTAVGARCKLTVLPGHGHLVTHLHPTTLSTLQSFFVDELLNKTIVNEPNASDPTDDRSALPASEESNQ